MKMYGLKMKKKLFNFVLQDTAGYKGNSSSCEGIILVVSKLVRNTNNRNGTQKNTKQEFCCTIALIKKVYIPLDYECFQVH